MPDGRKHHTWPRDQHQANVGNDDANDSDYHEESDGTILHTPVAMNAVLYNNSTKCLFLLCHLTLAIIHHLAFKERNFL